jgi:hypothetical protein
VLPTAVETEPGVTCRPCMTAGVGVGVALKVVVFEPPPPPPQAINNANPGRRNAKKKRFTVHLQRANAR